MPRGEPVPQSGRRIATCTQKWTASPGLRTPSGLDGSARGSTAPQVPPSDGLEPAFSRADENCTCHGGFNAQTWDDTVAGRTRPARGLQPRQRRAFRRRAEERPRARRTGAAIPGAAVRVADGGAVRNAVWCAAVQRDGALAVLRAAAAGLQPGTGVPSPVADDCAA